MVFVGMLLLFTKDRIAANYYEQNINFTYTEQMKSDIKELDLPVDSDAEGTYKDLMGAVYTTYNYLYNNVQEELTQIIPEAMVGVELIGELQEGKEIQTKLAQGEFTQYVSKDSFKRLAWIQSLEALGGVYSLQDAQLIMEPKDVTVVNQIVFALLYYGWMGAIIIAFSIIYYGIVVNHVSNTTKDYTDEEIDEHQQYFDNYYETFKTQRRKKE